MLQVGLLSLIGTRSKLLASLCQMIGVVLVTGALAYLVLWNPGMFAWAALLAAALFGDIWGTFWSGVRDRTKN